VVAINQNTAASSLILRGANTFTGGVTLTLGKVGVNPILADVDGTSGALGKSGNITFAGGSLLYDQNSVLGNVGGLIGDYSTRFKSTGGNAVTTALLDELALFALNAVGSATFCSAL